MRIVRLHPLPGAARREISCDDRNFSVGLLIAVAVFRGTVQETLPQRLGVLEVPFQHVAELRQREIFLLEHLAPDHRQGIGQVCKSDERAFDPVVTRAALFDIEPARDAVAREQALDRAPHAFAADAADAVLLFGGAVDFAPDSLQVSGAERRRSPRPPAPSDSRAGARRAKSTDSPRRRCLRRTA